jgi:hypothetical protein
VWTGEIEKFTCGDGASPASRAILATLSIWSTLWRQSKIQRLPMPCLPSVSTQSFTIESGVIPMPTTPFDRVPALSTDCRNAARTASSPFQGSSRL